MSKNYKDDYMSLIHDLLFGLMSNTEHLATRLGDSAMAGNQRHTVAFVKITRAAHNIHAALRNSMWKSHEERISEIAVSAQHEQYMKECANADHPGCVAEEMRVELISIATCILNAWPEMFLEVMQNPPAIRLKKAVTDALVELLIMGTLEDC